MSKRKPVVVWAVVDMHYEPAPVPVYASANRDNATADAAERNRYTYGGLVRRFVLKKCVEKP